MESLLNKEMKRRGTYIDFYSLVHAQKQWVKIEVVHRSVIHPLRVASFDFQSDPDGVHVSHVWQKGGDEVLNKDMIQQFSNIQ